MSTLRGSSCRTNFLSALRGAYAKPIFSALQDGKTLCFAVAMVTGTAIAFFLNCFRMAQPPGEAPDRNQKKTATNVFFLVSIFCFVGDRAAASTTFRF